MNRYYLIKLNFNITDYIEEQSERVVSVTDSLEKAKDIIAEYYVDNFCKAELSDVKFTINDRTKDMQFLFEEDSDSHVFTIKEIKLNEVIK